MLTQGVIDLSEDDQTDDPERERVLAKVGTILRNVDRTLMLEKARLLRARWMHESERFDANVVAKELADLAHTLKGYVTLHLTCLVVVHTRMLEVSRAHTSMLVISKTRTSKD